MATATCTVVGQAYGTQGSSISYGTSSTAYAGFNYSDWYPYILKFTTPSFSGKSTSLAFKISILRGKRNGSNSTAVSLRYALCKSDAKYSSYDNTTAAVSDTNQITSGTINFTGLTSSYSAKTLTISTATLSAKTTYYLILWGNNSGGYSQDYCTINTSANHSVTLTYATSRTLTISAGTGSGISVKRNGTALSNGATIYDGDVLTITFSASTGYNLSVHTVNGSTFTSGNTHTVSANVTVKSTATVKSYALSISAGAHSTIAVNRTSSPKQGAATGTLSNGAIIYYSDVLVISFAADEGYELTTHTVNGSNFDSGNTHTVTANVDVTSTAKALGLVYIGNVAYQAYIGNGTSWDLVTPYVGNGTSWDMCG